jgi:L-cysteine S-thiosulfotransferase
MSMMMRRQMTGTRGWSGAAMLRTILMIAAIAAAGAPVLAADTVDPASEFKAFRAYFTSRFPKVPLDDFVNGPYSMDEGLRKQWREIEELPPYEFAVDKGRQMFATPFANGRRYGDCFPEKGIGIRQNYPYFDTSSGQVITLELALNQCRVANGEAALPYDKDDMAALTAFMAFTSRGKRFDIKVPDDPRALAAYRKGEEYFYGRRGQLNFSCASCHVQSPGDHIRTEVLAPALGIMAAMPIYRAEWGSMGTVSRRLTTCNIQVRAEPLPPQDELYRDVEYFLTYMGNGLPVSGPAARP